jgi:hypothetical protein
MPTLISETRVKLEKTDMLKRVVLPRQFGEDGCIVPSPRTPGLHLSGLLKYVAKAARIQQYKDQTDEEAMPMQWALGHAWEEFAASLYPGMIWQPGEITEPVVMNPDGFSYEMFCEEPVIEEFKFNRSKRYTGADLIKKKWLWMSQGAGYCAGYSCEYVRWHVCSVLEFPEPDYSTYLVRFSEKELNGMRRIIEVNRAGAIKEGYSE